MNKIITFQKKAKKKTNIGVIIQARMTSKRFPGKSMALLSGKPIIEWVIERAKHIRAGNKKDYEILTVLAVPDEYESEVMLELADKLKVGNFLGSNENVLERYYQCSIFFNFHIVVRITADCPFLDPRVCSECLQLLIWRDLDYVSNSYPKATYPKGLDCEVFTMDCLEAAYKLAITDYDKEHVTPWMQKTEGIKRGNIVQQTDQHYKNWCIDYPEDIKRLEKEIIPKKEIKSSKFITLKPDNDG